MSDEWMFGMSDVARSNIYAERRQKTLEDRITIIEEKLDVLIEAMSVSMSCVEESEEI